MRVKQPICLKCGTPVWYVVGVFHVRIEHRLQENGMLKPTGGKFIGRALKGTPLTLECGGGHQWETEEVTL